MNTSLSGGLVILVSLMTTEPLFNRLRSDPAIALVASKQSTSNTRMSSALTDTYSLAYVEMRLVLTRLLWNFELVDLDPSSTNWADQNVYLLWEKPELWMRLKPVSKDRPRWLKD